MTALKLRYVLPLTAAAVAGLTLAPMTAQAATSADAPTLKAVYDVNGSSTVARTGSVVKIGPTTLTLNVNVNDASFTGTLPIPSAATSFKAVGILPTTATVSFIPVGQLTGQIGQEPAGGPVGNTVTSSAKYYLQLSNVSVGGVPAFVGNACRTILPVQINAATPADKAFDLNSGGTLTGTYTIGLFANCGVTTGIIDLLIPGTGNTVTLNLSNGRLG